MTEDERRQLAAALDAVTAAVQRVRAILDPANTTPAMFAALDIDARRALRAADPVRFRHLRDTERRPWDPS